MIRDERYIRIGFFEDFKGEDSILISADIYGILVLEQLFEKLSNEQSFIHLKELEYIDKLHNLNIMAICGKEDIGIIKINSNYYEWKLTKEKWLDFRMKATAMYRANSEGHNYLDSDSIENKDLQVVLSMNEYPLAFWVKYERK